LQGTTAISSKFQIEKRLCWPFSKTIRVNIKPICLLVNKTRHKLKLVEKTETSEADIKDDQVMYDLESREGQLCLSDINPNKKYRIAIQNEEYMVGDLKAGDFEMNKVEVAYESDWFTLKDEPVSPFYRQKTSLLNSLFLINKCWMDLKLYPVGDQSMYKQFYFVLSNEQDDAKPTTQYSLNGLSCKILTIRPKFVIKNKTKHSFKFKLVNDLMKQVEVNKLLSRYVQPDEYLVNARDLAYTVDEIINKSKFYLFDKEPAETGRPVVDEEITREIRKQRDNLNDLFYLHLESMDSQLSRQSKPLILTCNERALKQISTQSQSNENFLISRQCFSVYSEKGAGLSKEKLTKPFILTQKLLAEQNGQLVVALNEDPAILVHLYNHMDLDVYVWPRISANFIFENYVKNVKSINERTLSDLLKEEGGKKLKAYSSLTRQSSLSNMMTDTQQALNFMHYVPAGAVFKFNYDFIGIIS
jgi:hypothetical protein